MAWRCLWRGGARALPPLHCSSSPAHHLPLSPSKHPVSPLPPFRPSPHLRRVAGVRAPHERRRRVARDRRRVDADGAEAQRLERGGPRGGVRALRLGVDEDAARCCGGCVVVWLCGGDVWCVVCGDVCVCVVCWCVCCVCCVCWGGRSEHAVARSAPLLPLSLFLYPLPPLPLPPTPLAASTSSHDLNAATPPQPHHPPRPPHLHASDPQHSSFA